MRKALVCLALLVAALAAAPVSAGVAADADWRLERGAASPPARDAQAMAYDSARHRVVLFGGANEFNAFDFADTWEWDGTAWNQRTPETSPALRYGHVMAYDATREQVVLFGGYDFLSNTVLADTWAWDGTNWTDVTPEVSPPGRRGAAIAYDSARARVVLFAGRGQDGVALTDTWEWDGSSWIESFPATSPPPREYGAAAYDVARGRTVLFGGVGGVDDAEFLADTWEWDGSDWVQRVSANRPSGRTWHVLAFDASRGRTVLFGGYDGIDGLGDTWEYDGNDWLETTPATGPSPRVVASMVFDAGRSRTTLFAGYDGRMPLADTWVYDGLAWVERTPATSPPPRSNHAAAYDAVRRRTVVFAGYAGGAFFDDTWEWDGSVWAKKTPAISPPSRVFHAMAYDATRERVILFGGFGRRGAVADTWEWDGTNWVELTPETSPPARHSHTMVYDAARGRIVLFGGADADGRFGDTWEWDGTNWTNVTPVTSPPARYRSAMSYDTARGRAVLFGGCGDVECPMSDTWEWDGSSWVELTPLNRPRAVWEHAMAYDEERGRTVLFGGKTAGFLSSETWEWDGRTWLESLPGSSPAGRFHHVMTYDGVLKRVLLFGGINETYLADTWGFGPLAEPPAITCPQSFEVECQSAGQALVSIPPATASGSGAITIVNDHNEGGADASGTYPLGTTTVTFTATDGAGNVASCTTSITVSDTTPPVLTVSASPEFLWPPNHQLRPVHLTVLAVDVCDAAPVVLLESVTSSEPDDAPGGRDGATKDDIQGASLGTPDFDFLLRAERDAGGPGRTYSVRYRITDASGNAATAAGTVEVKHDPGGGPARSSTARRPSVTSSPRPGKGRN